MTVTKDSINVGVVKEHDKQALTDDVHQLRKDLKAWRQARKEEIEGNTIKPAPFVMSMRRLTTSSPGVCSLRVSYRNSPKLNAIIERLKEQRAEKKGKEKQSDKGSKE